MGWFFVLVELSVPNGTISAPSVREVCFASEVPAGVGGTLNFTLCEAQCFTAALPLLHLGVAQTSLNVEEQHKL